jgi:hypothetical protein
MGGARARVGFRINRGIGIVAREGGSPMRDVLVLVALFIAPCLGCGQLNGVEKGRDLPVELETVQLAGRGITPPVVLIEQGLVTVRGVVGVPQAGYALSASAEVQPGNRSVLTITATAVSGGMAVPVNLAYTVRLLETPAANFDLVVRHERGDWSTTALTWPVSLPSK